jgi:uncharacterized protein YabN with tetrapyrrole methylase and pyrophosphatase domain
MTDTGAETARAVAELDEVTRRLRRECPWDREQDERSIVPHTVEEAYELADAVDAGDDEKILDELGDVLFQVHFLALLLEERGSGNLAEVADSCRAKLIRRHPHIYPPSRSQDPPPPDAGARADPSLIPSARAGAEEAAVVQGLTADDVLDRWDRIKVEVEGRAGEDPYADVPENLPALLLARKVQRRAANRGTGGELSPGAVEAAARARAALAGLEALAAGGADGSTGSDADARAEI